MVQASLPLKQKAALAAVAVAILLPWLWFSLHKKPIYPVPDLVSFSGGRFIQKPIMHELESLEYQRVRGLTTFQLTLGLNPEGKLFCVAPAGGMASLSKTVLCSEETLHQWLTEHPELQLIVAVQGDHVSGFDKLKSIVPDYAKRVLVQLEDLTQYETIHAMGYTQFAWMLRDARMLPEDILQQVGSQSLQAIVLPAFLAEEDLIDSLRSRKIKTYAYLVDNCQVLAMMKEVGVNAVYTNDLTPYFCYKKPALTKEEKAKQLVRTPSQP